MAGELRIGGGIASDCLRCGAGNVVNPTASKWTCSSCGEVNTYWACKRCKKIFRPDRTSPGKKLWVCPSCHRKGGWRDWRAKPVSQLTPDQWMLDLYGDRLAEALSDPGRRRIDGLILSVTGLPGLTSGGCTVVFDRESVTVMLGNVSNQRRLNYSDITSLQIAGRGEFVTATAGGWIGGGFGGKGIIEGIALATVLFALASIQQHQIETIVHLNSNSGSVTLLNTMLLPPQWAPLLSPVVQRIRAAHQQAVPTAGVQQHPPPPRASKPNLLGDEFENYRADYLAARPFSRDEVFSQPCPVPKLPGVYAWWFRTVPADIDVSHCAHRDGLTLLYAGISPKRPPANGRPPSSQNLRQRITYHYSGSAEGSTLRKTLGVLLVDQLGIELRRVGSGNRRTFGPRGEVLLSNWMAANALVSWVVHPQPWLLERDLIDTLDLPLNLDGNRHNAFHAELTRLRAEAERNARDLPVLDE